MMTSRHALFLISSRSTFIAEAEKTGPAAGARISGRAPLAEGAAAQAAEALRSGSASAVLLDLDSDADQGLRTLREICQQGGGGRVLVASADQDREVILQAVRAGAADFLSIPLDRQALSEAHARLTRPSGAETSGPARRGRVMSFISAKGGCGATTVAVNLDVALCGQTAGQERSVALLDLDWPGGDASAMLAIKPAYTLADVAASIHRLDMDLLNSMAMRHDSGLLVLAAAGEGENPAGVAPDQISAIVNFLCDHHDDVVLAGGGMGETEMAAVNQAHMVHVVTTLDFLALKRAQTMIRRMREFGVTGDSLRVVVNKLDRNADLTMRDARQALDAPVVWSIPADHKTAERAVNEGVPFISKGKGRLPAAFMEYAALLASGAAGESTTGGMGRLLRKIVPGRAAITA